MTLLIGSEAEAGTNLTVNIEKGDAFLFEAAATGTVEAIKFHTAPSAQGATAVVCAILSDSAGTPGTVLQEKEKAEKPAENAVYEITGFSVSVTAGTKYWLLLLPPAGGSIKAKQTAAGGTASKLNSTPAKVKKVSEITVWTANEERGPMFLAATGTESGGVLKPKAEVKLTLQDAITAAEKLAAAVTDKMELKDTPTVKQTVNVTMTARFVLDDKFALLQSLAAALQTKLVLRESTAVLLTTKAALTSRMVLKEEISGTVSIKFITGFSVGLTLADKISAQQLLKASSTAKLVIGDQMTAAQAMRIAATSKLSFKDAISAVVKEGGAERRVTIFIFEE